MLDFITRIGSGYNKYMTHRARQHTLHVLSQQSDATLRDIGVSRELLHGGVTGWPWQPKDLQSRQCSPAFARQSTEMKSERPVSAAVASITSRSRTTYHKVMRKARAISELRNYSDRELRDLGITRGCIVEAVNHGRPGIEQPFARASTSEGHTSVAKPQCSAPVESEPVTTLPIKVMDQHADNRKAA